MVMYLMDMKITMWKIIHAEFNLQMQQNSD